MLAAGVLGFVAEVGVVDWFHFLFGVIVLHWVRDFQNSWGICDLWSWRRYVICEASGCYEWLVVA
jgi:hypothetical protein